MIVEPKIRGFICTTAHPLGCASHVNEQINYVKAQDKIDGPKRVLILGASTGYGLASRITAAFGANARTIGVSFEKPASGKRTASAGWYNKAAFEKAANEEGLWCKSLNGDAFSHEMREKVIDIIKNELDGKIDCVIYSLASPKRQDPDTKEVISSTLKPIGKSFDNKTVNVMTGEVVPITLEPATKEEIASTVQVMGGDDWRLWIDAMIENDVLEENAITVAYSYLGPEVTHDIYRNGTIGHAKEHLEETALALNETLQKHCKGHAYVSINKGLVTQASAAIPVVPLYISILYKLMKAKNIHENCIEQIYRLFHEHLYSGNPKPLDDKNRIRIDDLEMREDIQAEIKSIWETISTENLEEVSDIKGYKHSFYKLFGFECDDVDYSQDVDVEVDIPSIQNQE